LYYCYNCIKINKHDKVSGERGVKLAPHILKGTFVVVEGSGGVNAYINKNTGAAEAVIRCMVNSLEFGGKPNGGNESNSVTNTGNVQVINNPATINDKLSFDEELPF